MTKARDLGDNAQNTKPKVINAKGDLIVGTGSDAADRLAVSDNGSTLVADSSTSTGLRWQGNYAAGKNKIINGDFGIWQRGTSFTASGYAADRWYFTRGNTTTCSQQTFTAGSAPVTGYEGTYFLRYARTAGSASDYLTQKIEDVRTFAGQTVTWSFWAKASTAVTLTQSYIVQNFGSGGSSAVVGTGTSHSLTTSWQRFSVTYSVPSISGKTIGTGSWLELSIELASAMGNVTVDFWGVQIEAGNTATAFQTATGTLAGELAACQRYYYRVTGVGVNPLSSMAGVSYSATKSNTVVQHPVQMRVRPTSIDFNDLIVTDLTTYNLGVTSMTIETANTNALISLLDTTHSSGATTNRSAWIRGNSSNAYFGLSAEL